MIRVAVLFLISMVTVRSDVITPEDFFTHCRKFLAPSSAPCCTAKLVQEVNKYKEPIIKQCSELPPPPVCDRAICEATKQGYGLADGTLNKTGATKLIEYDFEGEDDIIDEIEDRCINGDTFYYGPPDECDLTKYEICVRVQVFRFCSDWRNDGQCEGLKEASVACDKLFSSET